MRCGTVTVWLSAGPPSHPPGRSCDASAVTDDELTDAWEAGTVFPDGVSHLQHLHIAWVLHRRHGPEEARTRLLSGKKRACEVHGCPEKFDATLTKRWARAIAQAIDRDGPYPTPDEFLGAHPELKRGDLLVGRHRQHNHGARRSRRDDQQPSLTSDEPAAS